MDWSAEITTSPNNRCRPTFGSHGKYSSFDCSPGNRTVHQADVATGGADFSKANAAPVLDQDGDTKSAFDHFIAHRVPPQNEVPLLTASSRLARDAIMDMDIRGTVRNGVPHCHVTL